MEAVPVEGEAADQGRDAEAMADHVGEGEEPATFVGMGEGWQVRRRTERRGSEAIPEIRGPGKGQAGRSSSRPIR